VRCYLSTPPCPLWSDSAAVSQKAGVTNFSLQLLSYDDRREVHTWDRVTRADQPSRRRRNSRDEESPDSEEGGVEELSLLGSAAHRSGCQRYWFTLSADSLDQLVIKDKQRKTSWILYCWKIVECKIVPWRWVPLVSVRFNSDWSVCVVVGWGSKSVSKL